MVPSNDIHSYSLGVRPVVMVPSNDIHSYLIHCMVWTVQFIFIALV